MKMFDVIASYEDVGSDATCQTPRVAESQKFSFISCLGTNVPSLTVVCHLHPP
jgi:hypothetical protein